jgi:hypothetical protein
MANSPKPPATACIAVPTPITSPPPPSSVRRRKTRVSAPKLYWARPVVTPAMVERMTTVAAVTPNSSMTAR